MGFKNRLSKKFLKFLSQLFFIIILATIFLLSEFPKTHQDKLSESENQNKWLVSKVIDGDTIEVVKNNEKFKVRLLGVDTPESVHPTKQVECFGKEASEFVKTSLLNQEVVLVNDDSQLDIDKYGRLLRYVYIDGKLFNQLLLEKGFAYEYTYNKPYKFQDEFKNAQSQAQITNAGLWGAKCKL
jgi:micrococcal nuclease